MEIFDPKHQGLSGADAFQQAHQGRQLSLGTRRIIHGVVYARQIGRLRQAEQIVKKDPLPVVEPAAVNSGGDASDPFFLASLGIGSKQAAHDRADRISIGALTHSVRAFDFSLYVEPCE